MVSLKTDSSTFSIVSWNVNSINARIEHLVDFLKTNEPDYVCLQELKCMNEKYPYQEIEKAGYKSSVFGQKAYNGVAILSKSTVKEVSLNFQDGQEDQNARFLAVDTGSFYLMCAYVPNGQAIGHDKFLYKMQWLKRAKNYLQKNFNSAQKIVLVGDFNIAPDDRDVYDPIAWKGHIHCSDTERDALKELQSFGFIDTLRIHHQQKDIFSWWDYREMSFLKNRGLRIDMIYATPKMAMHCKAASIVREMRAKERPSDHAPVVSIFHSDALKESK
jgi:exodeoxyribonuclease III